jgi:hypothetical protein
VHLCENVAWLTFNRRKPQKYNDKVVANDLWLFRVFEISNLGKSWPQALKVIYFVWKKISWMLCLMSFYSENEIIWIKVIFQNFPKFYVLGSFLCNKKWTVPRLEYDLIDENNNKLAATDLWFLSHFWSCKFWKIWDVPKFFFWGKSSRYCVWGFL